MKNLLIKDFIAKLQSIKQYKINCNKENYIITLNNHDIILKSFLYKGKNLKNETCSICKELYTENEEIVLLGCNHKFHYNCINKWINDNISCPLCRLHYNIKF